MRFLGFYVSRREDFSADIARECYGLTHEFVITRLHDEFKNGTPQARATLMLLDADMKAFVKGHTRPNWYKRLKRRIAWQREAWQTQSRQAR